MAVKKSELYKYILDKEGAEERKGIFVIDTSKGFTVHTSTGKETTRLHRICGLV